MPRHLRSTRSLAIAGAAGPVLFLAVTVVAGLITPGYDVREQSVSELALGPHGWLQTANFVVLGTSMIAAALALGLAPARRASRGAPAVLAVAGAGMVSVAFFTTDAVGTPRTSHGAAHDTVSLGVFLGLIVAAALYGRALRRAGTDVRLARYSRLTAIAVFALFAVFAVFAGDPGDPLHAVSGLLERVFIAVALAWVSVVSVAPLASSTVARRGETPLGGGVSP